ncbi:MAG: hypothetical protein ACM3PS_01315 [Syntrophothermus sp.]
MRRFLQYPWYVLLFAIYSPLALIAYNTGQVALGAVTRSLLVILAAVFVLTALIFLLVRDAQKTGLIATLILFAFFSYGHVYDLIYKMNVGGVLIGRHRYLIPVYLVILGVLIVWVVRSKRSFAQVSSTLTTIAIVMLLFPVYNLVIYDLRSGTPEASASAAQSAVTQTSPGEKLPDVYYIILDTYGRTDVLKKYADYDNSQFIQSLKDLGFYVAECSQSNYAHTGFSLASSLNSNYLDKLGLDFSNEASKREDIVAPYIKHNAVADRMRQMGYRIVAFETGYDFTTLDDTDILYPAPQSGLSDFELILLRSTALVYLDDAGRFKAIHPTALGDKQAMILSQFKTLKELPSVPGPKFVFAHILSPHFPYVFGPNGESLIGTELTKNEGDLTTREYFQGYHGQAIFTSKQILEVIAEIIKSSATPPIIIIQGDHGPSHAGEKARMRILNAYYFPGGKTAGLYPEITPVNSFRVMFNTYFNARFELLPDISYYSNKSSPDKTTIIQSDCKPQ